MALWVRVSPRPYAHSRDVDVGVSVRGAPAPAGGFRRAAYPAARAGHEEGAGRMEDRWAYRRRRIAVFVVAIVAAAATIATSPSNPQGHVDGSTPAKVVLTDDAPRAAARFVLTLSGSTLPLVTGAATPPSGTVSFVVADASGSGAGGDGPVQITASAVGVTTPAGSDPAGPSWPIDQLCRVAEPCRREFDVSVEWLRPHAEWIDHRPDHGQGRAPLRPLGIAAAGRDSDVGGGRVHGRRAASDRPGQPRPGSDDPGPRLTPGRTPRGAPRIRGVAGRPDDHRHHGLCPLGAARVAAVRTRS